MLDPDDPKEPVVRTDMTRVGATAPKWSIEPHSFDDNNTGMRLEFMHVDGQPVLQVYSNLRDKVVRLLFEAGGRLVHSDIRPFPDPSMHVEPTQDQAPPQTAEQAMRHDLPPFGETNPEGKDYHE